MLQKAHSCTCIDHLPCCWPDHICCEDVCPVSVESSKFSSSVVEVYIGGCSRLATVPSSLEIVDDKLFKLTLDAIVVTSADGGILAPT